MFTVKHRGTPKLAVVVAYNFESGRRGKVLASEPLPADFSQADLGSAAKRLVPQVSTHQVVLPMGIQL